MDHAFLNASPPSLRGIDVRYILCSRASLPVWGSRRDEARLYGHIHLAPLRGPATKKAAAEMTKAAEAPTTWAALSAQNAWKNRVYRCCYRSRDAEGRSHRAVKHETQHERRSFNTSRCAFLGRARSHR